MDGRQSPIGGGVRSAQAPFGGFYRGRRVLVTGDTGFKGAWLCSWLALLGADVHGFCSPRPVASARAAAGRKGMARDAATDIRGRDAVLAAVRRAQPELVFHLAAQSNVLRSYREPADTFEINVMGTVRLLEACTSVDAVRAVVVVTSDKCYADTGAHPHTEGDPLGGADPYSASKAAAELVSAAWRNTTPRPWVATARAGNVIGGGDWSDDRIVADLARAAKAGTPAVLRNPGAIRPWQHVLEPLAGYLQLGARLSREGNPFDRAWNFGPDPSTARTVGDLAVEFADRWAAHSGRPARPPLVVTAPGPAERVALTLDSSAAGRGLAWRTVLTFSETVDLTAEWYARAATDAHFDAGAVMAEQIERYQQRASHTTEAVA
jgi:CDP-glucose 4,6-dehydratase